MSRFCRIQNPAFRWPLCTATACSGWKTLAPGVLSLGTVYNQPYWIFYSATEPLDRLSRLEGKRIAVGSGGKRYCDSSAKKILGKGGVNSETATLLPFAGLAAVKALTDKKVDAVWIIGSPDATAVKSFLENPDVRLLGFPMAKAYARIFPSSFGLYCQKALSMSTEAIPAEITCTHRDHELRCWFTAIFIQKLSNSCYRQ